jgi:CheY-like chemotaxis protein
MVVGTAFGGGVKTILLIEDDAATVRLAQQILREAGYAADSAATGEQARAKLKVTPYHGIVLDLAIPGEDGYALATQLGDANRYTPLVIVGSDAPDARKRAFEAGAMAFLPKPFGAEAFRSVIHSVISPDGPRAPAPARAVSIRVPVTPPPPAEDAFEESPEVEQVASEGAIAVRFQDGPVYWCEPRAEGGWSCGRCEMGSIASAEPGGACSVCHAEVVTVTTRKGLGLAWLILVVGVTLFLGWLALEWWS